MREISLGEFIDENKSLSIHECNKCGSPVELVFEPYDISIEGKRIQIDKFPQLKCIKCNEIALTEKAKKVIIYLFDELVKGNRASVISKHKHLGKRYPFCQKYNFKYDYGDYENIPGLTALTGDGFLTPVFFHKHALIYFMHHPEYELNLFSETYGELRYKDEFIIPFGINRNDKVIMSYKVFKLRSNELHITVNSQNLREYECNNQTSGIRETLSETAESESRAGAAIFRSIFEYAF